MLCLQQQRPERRRNIPFFLNKHHLTGWKMCLWSPKGQHDMWQYNIWHMEWICSERNFRLAPNLIRRIISPNQDDLSYSTRNSFPGSRNWGSCQTQSLWLNNFVQCRRFTGGSSIAAAAWIHEGTYLIYGFLASISLRPRDPSWIWIR